MTDTMTLTGLVATTPRHLITAEGLPVTNFRLASNLRRFDRKQQAWVDAGTNWYTISTYRQLAMNVVGSVQKGDRVVVTGRLRIRDWENGERKGTNIELDADALGHDLTFGRSSFTRSIHSTPVEAFDSGDGQGVGQRDSVVAETDEFPAMIAEPTDAPLDSARELEAQATPF
jgi:single-strand DNA-binding protein